MGRMDCHQKGYHRLFIISMMGIYQAVLPCPAQNNMRGPVQSGTGHVRHQEGRSENRLLDFYQQWISPVNGKNRCPMHPSCSQYAKNAFQELSLHTAYLKTLDRLLRCGHELYYYPAVFVNGRMRWYDPVNKQKYGHDVQRHKNSL